MPRYQRIHKKLQAHGIDIWYTDCDGDVRPLLPGLMRGGYIPFLDHLCPPNIGFADYMHYLDVKEELFGMK